MKRMAKIRHLGALLAAALLVACAPQLSSNYVIRDFSQTPYRLKPGDVLNLGTTQLVVTDIGSAPVAPMHVPWRIPIRYVVKPAKLLPAEDALLQMFLVTRRPPTPHNPPQTTLPADTVAFINRHKAALWDALVGSLEVDTSATKRAELMVDEQGFCQKLKAAIHVFEDDQANYDAAITAFGKNALASRFSSTDCLAHPTTRPTEIAFLETGFRFTDVLESAQGNRVSPQGDFYASGVALTEYHGVTVERNGVRLRSPEGDERLWSLAEWQNSGACTDERGQGLRIDWVQTPSGKLWIAKDSYHDAEIIETVGHRDFYAPGSRAAHALNPLDPNQLLISVVIDRPSLNALYPSDVVAIGWARLVDGQLWDRQVSSSC
jgi:hypothetical protein